VYRGDNFIITYAALVPSCRFFFLVQSQAQDFSGREKEKERGLLFGSLITEFGVWRVRGLPWKPLYWECLESRVAEWLRLEETVVVEVDRGRGREHG